MVASLAALNLGGLYLMLMGLTGRLGKTDLSFGGAIYADRHIESSGFGQELCSACSQGQAVFEAP
jgi:hypothetical protein